MIVVVAVAVAIWVSMGGPRPTAVGATAIAFAVNPFLGIGVAATWVAIKRLRRISAERRNTRSAWEESVVCVEVTTLGVAGGISFDEATRMASEFLDERAASRLRTLRRTYTTTVPEPDGDPMTAMFSVARASEGSGAPLAADLTALTTEARSRLAAEQDERLARLPVKMLFPLALLILPGFVLVAVVPSVVGGLARLTP